jgi:hypothetical protein
VDPALPLAPPLDVVSARRLADAVVEAVAEPRAHLVAEGALLR